MVLWSWTRLIDLDRVPPRRVVVRFDLLDPPGNRFWMILDRPEAEVCIKPPDFPDDLIVTTDAVTLTDYHRGRLAWGTALRTGRLRVSGPRDLARALPGWGGRSPFADVTPRGRAESSG